MHWINVKVLQLNVVCLYLLYAREHDRKRRMDEDWDMETTNFKPYNPKAATQMTVNCVTKL